MHALVLVLISSFALGPLAVAEDNIADTPGVGDPSAQYASRDPKWLERLKGRYNYEMNLHRDEVCNGPEVGKIVVYRDGAFTPTTIPLNYAIERISDKELVAHVVFDFEDGRSNKRDKKFEGKFRKRVIQCLDYINDHLQGPNGEFLKIAVHRPNARLPKELAQIREPVKIGKAGIRASSREFEENQTCDITAHELLHHFGLVDEYPEKSFKASENVFEFDCRSIGPKSSIMYDQLLAYDNTKAGLEYKSTICKCDDTSLNCLDEMNKNPENWNRKTCPARTSPSRQIEMRMALPDEWDDFKKGKVFLAIPIPPFDPRTEYPMGSVPDVNKISPSRTGSLISESQFNAIAYPYCLEKNRAYYACAQNAYRTSIDKSWIVGDGCDIEARRECERNHEKVWPGSRD